MKTRYLAILATLAFLGFSVPASAHGNHNDPCTGPHKNDSGCDGGGGDSSEGGKAFLFEIDATDVLICGGATDTGASFGHVSWSGNVLWDPINIHAHFKLQLKDVDSGTYAILGNNGIECDGGTVDYPICESDEVEDCEAKSITVKEGRRQGRTSGALRLPGNNTDDPTTVWITVTVNGSSKILRSTSVTIVLPPNAVGTGE